MKKLTMLALLILLIASQSFALTITQDGTYGLTDPYITGTKYDIGATVFGLTDTDGVSDTAVSTLFFEIAGWAPTNTFGLYTYHDDGAGNISVIDELQIFAGADSGVANSSVIFDFDANTATSFYDSIDFNINKFGFYLDTALAGTWYSQSGLNTDLMDHFKVYDTSDVLMGALAGPSILFAIEDLPNLGDADFQDMVVGVSDIAAVPEPGTLMLLGFGIFGLTYLKRRKS